MSYSGEWVYAIRSNLRNNSIAASQMQHESLPLSTSPRSMNLIIFKSEFDIFFKQLRWLYQVQTPK
jgi:hypothetical protein